MFYLIAQPFSLGTLKVIQKFTTHIINLIVSCPMLYSGSLSLRLGVLDFVAQHCSDRVSYIIQLHAHDT